MPVMHPAARQRKFKFSGSWWQRLLEAPSPGSFLLILPSFQERHRSKILPCHWQPGTLLAQVVPDVRSAQLRDGTSSSTSASHHNPPVTHRVCQSCAAPGTEPCRGLLLPGSGRVPGPGNQPSALETLYLELGGFLVTPATNSVRARTRVSHLCSRGY